MYKFIVVLFFTALITIGCEKTTLSPNPNKQGDFRVEVQGLHYTFSVSRKPKNGTEFKEFFKFSNDTASHSLNAYTDKGDSLKVSVVPKFGHEMYVRVFHNGIKLFNNQCTCPIIAKFGFP